MSAREALDFGGLLTTCLVPAGVHPKQGAAGTQALWPCYKV